MPATQYGTKPRIAVSGADLSHEVDLLIEEVVVEDHLHLPDTFLIRFRDPDRDALKRAGLSIGAPITIYAAAVGDQPEAQLISGEVTALEADYDATGSHALARGYDRSHRFHRGRVTQNYQQMTDADIAHKIAQRAGIQPGKIAPTKTVHEHVSQMNLTDWEFLKARAREIGYECSVRDGKLDFCPPASAEEGPATGDLDARDPLQLAFGAELEAFRPRVTSAQQVKEVRVRGWDPMRKEALVGLGPSATKSVSLSANPATVGSSFGDAAPFVTGKPLASQIEVDVAAAALAEQLASAFAEADGVAGGNPKLKAGTAVSIALVGDAFEGQYTLSSTRHVYDAGGYKTHFMVSGRQDRSLLGLISGGVRALGSPMAGVDVGIVADVRDPENLGRVKVTFPSMDDKYVSHWARVVQPGAGKDRGAVVLPEVGDEVLVAFGHGDVRAPYVVGGLYNGVDRPKVGDDLIDDATGAVRRRGFISKKGHKIVFLDDDRQSGVMLATADDGLRIALKDTGTTIRVNSNGDIEIEATKDITIKAGGRMTLRAIAGIDVESGGPVSLKGSTLKLN